MRLLLAFLFLPLLLPAQTTPGLTALYSFESNLGDATGNASNLGAAVGAVDYDCGISGQALLLGGPGDFVRIPGGTSNNVNRVFREQDLTVSLYFKPVGDGGGRQYLVSKRDTNCAVDGYFGLTYSPDSRLLTATLGQDGPDQSVTTTITDRACWQLVTIVRQAADLIVYVNGQRLATSAAAETIDLTNGGELFIGSSACLAAGESSFIGLIDDVRIYGRALTDEEVADLYVFPDRILNPPTRLFLGQSVDVNLNSNCGTTFSWSPANGVVSPTVAEPTITPPAPGRRVYTVTIGDDQSICLSRDSLVLDVIDPDNLECSELYVPKAFTPNGVGPVENETFGVSNPFAVPDLASFEVYDRNGALVFRTDDAFTRWDGSFRGRPVNPGAMLWRAVYTCREQEIVKSGSVIILR